MNKEWFYTGRGADSYLRTREFRSRKLLTKMPGVALVVIFFFVIALFSPDDPRSQGFVMVGLLFFTAIAIQVVTLKVGEALCNVTTLEQDVEVARHESASNLPSAFNSEHLKYELDVERRSVHIPESVKDPERPKY